MSPFTDSLMPYHSCNKIALLWSQKMGGNLEFSFFKMKTVTKSPRTEILRILTLRYKLIVRNWKISTTTVLQRCLYAWSLTLDLQDGGVVIKNGQNDFVHVLPQTQVYLLLLLQSINQLRAKEWEREREREKEKEKRKRARAGEKEWSASDERPFQNVSSTPVHQQQTYLISWCIVNLSCQALSFGLTRKQVLSLIQTQTENLSIKVIVLIPELMVLLGKE